LLRWMGQEMARRSAGPPPRGPPRPRAAGRRRRCSRTRRPARTPPGVRSQCHLRTRG
jgi:hypothetical protein